ncbi:MAG: hypothetical protein MHM6MM_002905 [Cercozoa sp. M6MM]
MPYRNFLRQRLKRPKVCSSTTFAKYRYSHLPSVRFGMAYGASVPWYADLSAQGVPVPVHSPAHAASYPIAPPLQPVSVCSHRAETPEGRTTVKYVLLVVAILLGLASLSAGIALAATNSDENSTLMLGVSLIVVGAFFAIGGPVFVLLSFLCRRYVYTEEHVDSAGRHLVYPRGMGPTTNSSSPPPGRY